MHWARMVLAVSVDTAVSKYREMMEDENYAMEEVLGFTVIDHVE